MARQMLGQSFRVVRVCRFRVVLDVQRWIKMRMQSVVTCRRRTLLFVRMASSFGRRTSQQRPGRHLLDVFQSRVDG